MEKVKNRIILLVEPDLESPDVHISVARRPSSSTDIVKKASDTKIPLFLQPEEEQEFPGDGNDAETFIYSHGITAIEAEHLLKIHGRNELPEKIIPKWYIFVSQLWQPMPIMIWIAAIVEIGIGNPLDMGILLFIQFANASIGFYEITKAGDAVAALKSQLQAKATVKRDGAWTNIDAALVVPGDLCLLAAGSAIPADCRVNEGQIEVDQSGLTGESLPVTMYRGDSCKMGSTVVRGEQEGTVEFTGANSFFGKTAALLKVSKLFAS
jgi:H+-transporting ATPase